MKTDKFVEEVLKDCVNWYQKKNGDVSPKDCFEIAIQKTRQKCGKVIDKWYSVRGSISENAINELKTQILGGKGR